MPMASEAAAIRCRWHSPGAVHSSAVQWQAVLSAAAAHAHSVGAPDQRQGIRRSNWVPSARLISSVYIPISVHRQRPVCSIANGIPPLLSPPPVFDHLCLRNLHIGKCCHVSKPDVQFVVAGASTPVRSAIALTVDWGQRFIWTALFALLSGLLLSSVLTR